MYVFFKGGLKGTSLISGGFVTHYIPFFPLTKEHVRKCIKDYLDETGREAASIAKRNEKVEAILREIEFTNKPFADYGCRPVKGMVDYDSE